MSEIRQRVLSQLLASDSYISGETLSRQLDVSRTAIWKHIEELRREGYQIEAVRRQGYRLIAEPTDLSPSMIRSRLKTKWLGHQIAFYPSVSSTQNVAQQMAREGAPMGTTVIADQQETGKGRMGRSWYSPPKSGLWISFVLRPHIPLTSVPQLTLLTALAVLKAVEANTSLSLDIKWPNDLLVNGKKVAGILLELKAEADQVHYVIVGIGLNVNQKREDFPEELREKASSLSIEAGETLSRQALLISLLNTWEELYSGYEQFGFQPIKTLWEAHTISIGQPVTARTPQGVVQGIATGINSEGALLVKDRKNNIHKIYSADIEI